MNKIRIELLVLISAFVWLPAHATQPRSVHGNVRTTQARVARPKLQAAELEPRSCAFDTGLDIKSFVNPKPVNSNSASDSALDLNLKLDLPTTSAPNSVISPVKPLINTRTVENTLPPKADYTSIEKEYADAVITENANSFEEVPGGTSAPASGNIMNQAAGNLALAGASKGQTGCRRLQMMQALQARQYARSR